MPKTAVQHHRDFPLLGELKSPLIPPSLENNQTTTEKLCIDDMLQNYCGEFGPWQMKQFVLASLAWVLEGFHTMVMIFADHEPAWRCVKDAGEECTAAMVSHSGICKLDATSWYWIGGKWSSTVAEWGLICDDKYKIGLVQALFFVGTMIGAATFGHLSDSFLGRKGSLIVVCLVNAIFGCLTSLAPNYYIYTILRFLTGIGTGGVGLCAFVLATEPIGPSNRDIAGMCSFYFLSGGIAILSGIAYIFPSWRALYVASSLPSLFLLVFFVPFLSESPRWYLVRGKVDSAMKVMHSIANSNGNHLPQEALLVLTDSSNNDGGGSNGVKETTEEDKTKGSVLDVLIKVPIIRVRLILAIGINLLCSIVYYGINLNVVNLDTNLYVSVLLNAVAEIPSNAITSLLLHKFGRRPLTTGTMWLSGFFCILGWLMNGGGGWKIARMFCGVMGIFAMGVTYNLQFVYTTELFPTVVRNASLGCTTLAAQLGAVLAPLVVVLGDTLAFMLFGAFGVVGGFLTLCLPETLHRPLYDTVAGMEEGEAIIK